MSSEAGGSETMNAHAKYKICRQLYSQSTIYHTAKSLTTPEEKSAQHISMFLGQLYAHEIVVRQRRSRENIFEYKLESLYWTVPTIEQEIGGFTND